MKRFHRFTPDRCDWCDIKIPLTDAQPPNPETHGHAEFEREPNLEFFNDIGTRGNRRNLCLKCFNRLCAFEDQQPKMIWLEQQVEKLHQKAMKQPHHLEDCPYCQKQKRGEQP